MSGAGGFIDLSLTWVPVSNISVNAVNLLFGENHKDRLVNIGMHFKYLETISIKYSFVTNLTSGLSISKSLEDLRFIIPSFDSLNFLISIFSKSLLKTKNE